MDTPSTNHSTVQEIEDSLFIWWKSKTLWGSAIAVFGYLSQPDVLAILPPKWAQVVTGAGVILGAFGLRQAVAKNGVSA